MTTTNGAGGDGTAARLAGVTVQRVEGDGARDVALGEAWRDRPVVLAFIRHFG